MQREPMDPNKPGALNNLFTREDYEKEKAKQTKKKLEEAEGSGVPVYVPGAKRPDRPKPMTELTGLSDGMKLPKKSCSTCLGTGWMWLAAIPLPDGSSRAVGRWTLCLCTTRVATTHSKLANAVPHNPKPKRRGAGPKPFSYKLKTVEERHESGEWLSPSEKAQMRLREKLHAQIELEAAMKNPGGKKL